MKLFYSNTSPYSRKVRMVVIEKGLTGQVEEVLVNPFEKNPELARVNPLGKIPALLLDNSDSLFDSPVICNYLDSLPSKKSLLVPSKQKWPTLRWEALADGMTDTTYNLVMEIRRPIHEQSVTWIDRWSEGIHTVLSCLEDEIDHIGMDITLAHLAFGASIGYLEFRTPNLLYESSKQQVSIYPKLDAWYKVFTTHPSMIKTMPHD